MVKIRVSEVIHLKNRQKAINSVNLDEIEWMDDAGNILMISEEFIKEFKYTGLNNLDFIDTEFYKNGWDND